MTSDNDVFVRRYKPSDLAQLKSMFVDGMKDVNAPDAYIKEALETDLSSIKDTYFAGRGTFFVVERKSDAKIIGAVGLQDLAVPAEECQKKGLGSCNNMGELRRMTIHSSERRKGRGKLIMKVLLSYAVDQGFDGLTGSTGKWMDPANSLYKLMGGKVVEEVDAAIDIGGGSGRKALRYELLFS
eukprot:CAMPEP_0194329560 /NCGR_PEP_ID=MMETSP0171-20130528/48713_1 /TAXON_ID=218684 /ORGANISM="Corethron pennatum, Strain L29A3" /LENGTH=183 /DNA_ID=CAMNT_0039090329 /DNA_START=134 /DNA_END=685 /DNA_ORIENTATION=+